MTIKTDEHSRDDTPTAELFRVMSLPVETQNEMDVLKPWLDDREVMRLSSSFGVLPSINAKDFAFNMLEARDFDDEFGKFLRDAVGLDRSISNTSMKVRVGGLFGRQDAVRDELMSMGIWTAGMASTLAGMEQGVFCVHVPGSPSTIVLFAWLQDSLLAPVRLRDTATYVMRFFTSICSDVVLCLTDDDYGAVQFAQERLQNDEDSDEDGGEMYSVSLRVERQDEREDSTQSTMIGSVNVPRSLEGAPTVLIAGSFSAVATRMTRPGRLDTLSFTKKFANWTEASAWLKEQATAYRLVLPPLPHHAFAEGKVAERLIKTFGCWPEEMVAELNHAAEVDAAIALSTAQETARKSVQEQWQRLRSLSDRLFVCDNNEVRRTYEQELGTLLQSGKLTRDDKNVLRAPTKCQGIKRHYLLHAAPKEQGEMVTVILGRGSIQCKRCAQSVNRANEQETEVVVDDAAVYAHQYVDAATQAAQLVFADVLAQVMTSRLRDMERELDRRFANDLKERQHGALVDVLKEHYIRLRTRTRESANGKLRMEVTVKPKGNQWVIDGNCEKRMQCDECWRLTKVEVDEDGRLAPSFLGYLPVENSVVGEFTYGTRSLLRVTARDHHTIVTSWHFDPNASEHSFRLARRKKIKLFGKLATAARFDAENRTIAFVHKSKLHVYKFNDHFDSMQLAYDVDLDVASSLDNPASELTLLRSSAVVVDEQSNVQIIELLNERASTEFRFDEEYDSVKPTWCSAPFALEDDLVLGQVVLFPTGDDTQQHVVVRFCATEDHRVLPSATLDLTVAADRVGVTLKKNVLYVHDPVAAVVHAVDLDVTVRSDTYRMCRATDTDKQSTSTPQEQRRLAHWLWVLYHVFEKFPVRGLLGSESTAVSLRLFACIPGRSWSAQSLHDFSCTLKSSMEQMNIELLTLNKELYGLDLANSLMACHVADFNAFGVHSVFSFITELVTFVPVQICRAEGNKLHVMIDGLDPSQREDDVSVHSTVVEVAQSIRFGLLSPLLSSWPGKCVVVTSMGKQSTGKSYYLNHVTGTSFAISGQRCTDGAWLTVRVLDGDVLLLVIDFEGLGSFERIDQEDVLLSVLNAAISHFTVFRIESRFDKDVDMLFSSFQKGVRLISGDKHLFQGSLFLSVRDVNPNDQSGVVRELKQKFSRLLAANRERSFVSEMYSGQLEINCSPPLGTIGYYKSLTYSKRFIEHKLIKNGNIGFESGSTCIDCLRLLLAKISVLDWTRMDESTYQLQQAELEKQLPGLLRTGCLVSPHLQSEKQISSKNPVMVDQNDGDGVLSFVVIVQEHPAFASKWQAMEEVDLTSIPDHDVDFGSSVTSSGSQDWRRQCEDRRGMFEMYLNARQTSRSARVTRETQAMFDAFASFLVHRRVTKVRHWVRERVDDKAMGEIWRNLEQRMHECADPGICEQSVTSERKEFVGQRDKFEYDQWQMEGRKKACVVVLERGCTAHEGSHRCGSDQHFCRQQCPTCTYFCNKPMGHAGIHSTKHGSMVNALFLTDEDSFEIGGHHYVAGELGAPEMCGLHCARVGRGHVHFEPCSNTSKTCVHVASKDNRRHCTRTLTPKPATDMDELLHTKYWDTIGWEDPCAAMVERSEFDLCPAYCCAEEHQEREAPSCCLLPAWHDELIDPSNSQLQRSQRHGHEFRCVHEVNGGLKHHVFVLDCSGSMRGSPWSELCTALHEYVVAGAEGGAREDIVSVITFGGAAHIIYERRPITSLVSIGTLPFGGGGTLIGQGLGQASAVLSRSNYFVYKPVLIFVSDGRPGDGFRGMEKARKIYNRYAHYGLEMFAVGFGNASLPHLQQLARIFRGSVRSALDGGALKQEFRSIAMRSSTMEDAVTRALEETFKGLDEHILEYLVSVVTEQVEEQPKDEAALAATLEEGVVPFVLSSGFTDDEAQATALCHKLATNLFKSGIFGSHEFGATEIRKLDHVQSIEEHAIKDMESETTSLMERMWGFDRIRKKTNLEMEAQQSTQSQRQVRKQIQMEKLTLERSAQEAEEDREWEDAKFLPDLSIPDTGERDIHVPRMTINFKGKTLLSDTSLKLVAGRRYGLIGKNGCGKTTLLRFISHYELEGFPRHIRIQHVEQESASKLSLEEKSVLQVVIETDYERTVLLQREKELLAMDGTAENTAALKKVYDRLAVIDSDTAEARARAILHGLQFPERVIDGPARALSGGWRMRTALAGALFMSPDLLLLDEPTNHLDLEAVIWLETYLETYEKTMIVVSHDRNFLNAVTTDTIYLSQQKLTYYKGNYNTFEKTVKENLRQQRKAYEAQQMRIKHMQEFIDRFRANAKKAPLVQSRVKALDKILRNELIEEPEDERSFRMTFPPPEALGRPIISVDSVSFRYSEQSPLLFSDVHMGIDMSSRVGILGVNGSGKSTLINIMLGKLRPTTGNVTHNPRVRISTFTQHHIDSLDLSKSAVENMMMLYPGHESDEFRNHLGRFNLSGELAMKATRTLSGGQKSRVGFAIMTWRLPHILVLDEPTNHLDMETIDALIDALRDFKGGVVIVSHDQHFVTSVCDELWVVVDQKVARFRGNMAEYKSQVLGK
ncbi:TPA: hypothetical protein N0F65_002139 [Lagenidium giganteum]|uniref:VWFA domain-containing protein n=1 Tax=Lagenidium giganteum TaxID=4803 RepID=A0AAV2ZH84_9STRA|nr:TPA: hypothetical protein N0F65_002139 [Lagenidium giganteum]